MTKVLIRIPQKSSIWPFDAGETRVGALAVAVLLLGGAVVMALTEAGVL